jgi:alkylation response protein AidB-like acyl-CoA dehydrogenase
MENDETLLALREAIREVLQHRSDSMLASARSGEVEQSEAELWGEAAALGWLGLGITEEHGGLGLGFGALAVLYEELGRYAAPLAAMPALIAADVLSLAGNAGQRTEFVPKLAAGELRVVVTLPLQGQPLPAYGADGTVSGHWSGLVKGATVDLLFLPVRKDATTIDMVIVDPRGEGVTVTTEFPIDLTRMLCSARLEGVLVDTSRRLTVTTAHWERLLDHASVALACDSIGGAAEILDRTVGYLCTRTQFGRLVGSFQALKHRAASWKVLFEGSRALTGHAAAALAAGLPEAAATASAAKASACDIYTSVAGDSIQLHGGIGFTWEHACHLFMKRARLNAALFGTTVQHRERVAAMAFGEVLGDANRRGSLVRG